MIEELKEKIEEEANQVIDVKLRYEGTIDKKEEIIQAIREENNKLKDEV